MGRDDKQRSPSTWPKMGPSIPLKCPICRRFQLISILPYRTICLCCERAIEALITGDVEWFNKQGGRTS